MRKILVLLSFIIALGTQAQFLNNLTVTGSIANAETKMLYFSKLAGSEMRLMDSCEISSNSKFYFSLNIEGTNFYQISNGGKQYAIIIPEKGETITIDLDAQNMMQPSNISGSPNTIQVYDMLKNFSKYDASMKNLETEYQKVSGTAQQDSVGQILAKQYEVLNKARLDYLKKEISEYPSLASLLFIDKLPIDENLDLYEKVDKVLFKLILGNF